MHTKSWSFEEKKCYAKWKFVKNVHIKESKKLKIYLIFIKVVKFWRGKSKFTHVFSHFCLPFPDFFAKVCTFANFYEQIWITHIISLCKPFLLFVAYWQALENECPKQLPSNSPPNPTYCNFKLILCFSHSVQNRSFILDMNNNFSPQCIIIQQFYQIFSQCLCNNMYWQKKTKLNVLLFLIISQKINHQNISCPTFDIHKSKLVVAKWHSIKVGKHIIV
jgi:hypothetical protein